MEKRINNQLEKLPEYVNDYFNAMSVKDNSKLTYAYTMNSLYKYLGQLCGKPIKDIMPKDIEEYFSVEAYSKFLKEKLYSDSKINFSMKNAKQLIAFLSKEKLIEKEFAFPSIPRMKTDQIYSEEYFVNLVETIEEIETNLESTYDSWYKERDILIFKLIYHLGLKTSECTHIKVSDIDINNHSITINKKDELIMDLDDTLWEPVYEYYLERLEKGAKKDSLFFINNRKEGLGNRCLQNIIKKMTEGVENDITPELLRLACGAKLYMMTGNMVYVAMYMRYSYMMAEEKYSVIKSRENDKVSVRVKVI